MVLKFFKDIKRKAELEEKIMRFARKVSELQEEQPKLAHRYLIQATKLYHQEFNGLLPNEDYDREYNKIFLSFFDAYSPKITHEPHPKLV